MTEPATSATAVAARRRTLLLALGFALAALLLWGGYGNHWSWTGINGQTATLWDWLKLILLPLAFAILPIWLRPDARLQHDVKVGALVAGILLFLVALGGYLIPWGWTGFRGNSLWDWLNLVALPLAVALAPMAPEIRAHWQPRHWTAAATGAGVFVFIVVAGYLVPWAWTGFTGNTAWDWLHLLVLPLLVPAVLIPTLKPVAEAPMTTIESASAQPRAEPPANADQAPVETPKAPPAE
jgi:hypothetical protein